MMNNDQDWAFTGVANTAIVKAIAEPTEVPVGGFTPGTTVVYTLTVTNEGPSPATGVIAQDKLPVWRDLRVGAGRWYLRCRLRYVGPGR